MMPQIITTDAREVATILASLRAAQNVQQHEALAPEIVDIATDGGAFVALDDGEVDALCERLNSEPSPYAWVVQGEHFRVPGIITSVHLSKAGAEARALELVNQMLNDTSSDMKPEPATAENWLTVMEWLEDYHGAGHCYVDVNAHGLES